jgi:hypothetical protein
MYTKIKKIDCLGSFGLGSMTNPPDYPEPSLTRSNRPPDRQK